MQYVTQELRRIGPFATLNDEELNTLAPHVAIRTYDSNRYIFRAGESGANAYFLISGSVHVTLTTHNQEEIVVCVPADGELFEITTSLDATVHNTSALALSDSTVLEIERDGIQWLAQTSRMAIIDFMSTLARQLNATHLVVHNLNGPRATAGTKLEDELDFSSRLTDSFTNVAGSWTFVCIAFVLLVAYGIANLALGRQAWDPYPFILLNLCLSLLAAFQAPIIIMRLKRGESRAGLQNRAWVSNSDIKRAVTSVFDSNQFLTTLRTVLPTGADDSKYGFDFIPYLLHSIDDRRRRVSKQASLFLAATVTAAVMFTGVVLYFGYILVNESAAGSAKYLAQLEKDTATIKAGLDTLEPTYNNSSFQQKVASSIEKLRTTDASADTQSIKSSVSAAIGEASLKGDEPIFAFINALHKARGVGEPPSRQGKDYVKLLDDTTKTVTEGYNELRATANRVNNSLSDLNPLIENANKALSTPEYRTAELVKRLGLGIVVSTFFLALLRYLGTLYRVRYEQVVAAEHDDFMVRRFYVAFKNSTTSEEQRKAVLVGFMAGSSNIPAQAEPSGSDETSKQSYDLIKELVAALTKKL
jgi:uncharacterized membrane protein